MERKKMRERVNFKNLTGIIFLTFALAGLLLVGCQKDTAGPKELLERFFASAVKQDYGATYDCYYGAYKDKVSREEFIKHRKEASVLQAYQIVSIKMNSGDSAEAEVRLTFGPSEKLKRKTPATITVKEDMIREKGGWKIKVW
jgi:hypothetical protein